LSVPKRQLRVAGKRYGQPSQTRQLDNSGNRTPHTWTYIYCD